MFDNMNKMDSLKSSLTEIFNDRINLVFENDELTMNILDEDWLSICNILKNDDKFCFDSCIDLCGIDYLSWGKSNLNDTYSVIPRESNKRFAVVAHLLSIKNNLRLRIRTWASSDEYPIVQSLVSCWPGFLWFEREAFDLFGIVFNGNPDLRRILTDYGFIGHPFRKDFPLSGNVEMRYDNDKKKIIYQGLTIESREIVPRIIREDSYYNE
ncbi:NADH dehydrogenase I subunit C [Candidatus Kinetoplastibacterium oncopeltii TCC290E]|uniref:NADH-quinone oxidoreductase subunit C n=1 Tax=Candidatus Kinetoplastidibacterium stringomonadis TCC290E TaxID=1208920 RepID=M1LWP3_9PROT|nr:NADH-quinone oxidoreductase subunit C [Candidatus Kinetoplastibacterium oncopeltii]AGF48491.1 NADH dehydrogenase I subunit C [Candidatus Kinetoplastibacterium oncopeltii TCC290E]